MQNKVTRWFYPSKGEFPVRDGVYERQTDTFMPGDKDLYFSYFRVAQRTFYLGDSTAEGALNHFNFRSRYQDAPWRGVIKEDE